MLRRDQSLILRALLPGHIEQDGAVSLPITPLSLVRRRLILYECARLGESTSFSLSLVLRLWTAQATGLAMPLPPALRAPALRCETDGRMADCSSKYLW